MQNKMLHLALTKMGYRKLKANMWGKPVSFQFLLYEEDKDIISNNFLGIAGSKHVWNTGHILEDTEEKIIQNIKVFESISRLDIRSHYESKFEFLSIDQLIEL